MTIVHGSRNRWVNIQFAVVLYPTMIVLAFELAAALHNGLHFIVSTVQCDIRFCRI